MRLLPTPMNTASGPTLALLVAVAVFPASATAAETKVQSTVVWGKELAVEYCQACHYFEGTDQAGTVGPPLLAMKPRFPDRRKLEAILYDPQLVLKPHTMMPPFGRNGVLDEKQIELIIDFIYTL